MNARALVNEILRVLPEELRRDASIRSAIMEAVASFADDCGPAPHAKSRRRAPGPFDPMAMYREAPDQLRTRLADLEIEQLKDIVAEHGMDRSKLAMKWKTADRLIELILATVISRSQKGDAFRKPGADQEDGV